MRNRAAALLTASSALVAFAVAVGLLNVDPSRGNVNAADVSYLLAAAAVIVIAGVIVARPTGAWNWGIGGEHIAKLPKLLASEVETYRALFTQTTESCRTNRVSLRRKSWAFQAGVVALLMQLALLAFLRSMPNSN